MRSRTQATMFQRATGTMTARAALVGMCAMVTTAAAASPNILTWLGSSGLYPDEIQPCYTHMGSPSTPPTLAGDILTITTVTNSETSWYRQTHEFLNWAAVIEIEFEARLVSGSSSASNRAPMMVAVTVVPNTGALLLIDSNKVFILDANGNAHPSLTAFVDTTQDFRHYRFTIQPSTGEVHVYYEHDPVPLLIGAVFTQASSHGAVPRIFFGEASGGAHGVSEWRSFSHNASLVVGDLNGDGHVGVADLLLLLQAWGPSSDPADCPADLDGDGAVGVGDLLILLSNWGPACP